MDAFRLQACAQPVPVIFLYIQIEIFCKPHGCWGLFSSVVASNGCCLWLAIKSVFKCLHYWNAACILPWMDGCDQEKIYFNYHVWFHLLHLDYLPSLLKVKTNKQKRTSYMQVVCKIVLNLFIAVCFCRSIVPN